MKKARTVLTAALSAALLVLGTVGVAAAPPTSLSGGGWANNDNSGSAENPNQQTQFGFSARATDDGETATHPTFGTDVTIYDAEGEFHAANWSDDGEKLTQATGEVVCIANLGPSSAVDGGGDADAAVWEIRVAFDNPEDEGPDTVYGSFFVQDNGHDDYLDESFAQPTSPDCGQTSQFQLEEVLRGQITSRG